MSEYTNVIPQTTDEAPQEILDLTEALSHLPAEYRISINPLVNKVLDSARRRRRILNLVQDALGQLRFGYEILEL